MTWTTLAAEQVERAFLHDLPADTGRREGGLSVEASRAAPRRARGEQVVVGARRKRPS